MSEKIGVLDPIFEAWDSAINVFLDYCKAKRLSKNTIDYYYYRLMAQRRYIYANDISESPTILSLRTI